LQSAAGVFAAGALAAGFAAVPLAVAGFGAHTPITVITAAFGGTEADISGGAGGACGFGMLLPGTGPAAAGGGALGAACPQASVPNRTHISQLLLIIHFLQDWWFRKLKMPSSKS
jgi:hypothetical protein